MSSGNNPAAMEPADTGDVSAAEHLNRETGVIAWDELVRFFARGVVIRVAAAHDLVEVAECLVRDDTVQLEMWLEAGTVARASDDDARDWSTRKPEFWCVVTAPWVLVQECEARGPASGSVE